MVADDELAAVPAVTEGTDVEFVQAAMRHIGPCTVMFNPFGPRLVVYWRRRPERQDILIAVGGWLQGRESWPRRRFLEIVRY